MITIISATNRPNALTHIFSKKYHNVLKEKGMECQWLSLEDIPITFGSEMYSADKINDQFKEIQDNYIIGADGFVFVLPEYNGSFPGILKLFIDACTIRNYPKNFRGKKAALVGVSDGRAGNLIGLEHLSGFLQYLGVTIMPNRQPFSGITPKIDAEKQLIIDEEILKTIESNVKEMVGFF